MKVIISGATGFIGSHVLKQCIEDDSISMIFALSRRPLTSSLQHHPKVTSILVEDFLSYSEATLDQLAGTEVCFWALGNKKSGTPEQVREIDVGYPQKAATVFADCLQPQLGKPFRFVHLSAVLAEKDPDRPLWFLADGRRAKGEAELAMLRCAQDHVQAFKVFVIRPGMVLSANNITSKFWEWLWPAAFVSVTHLAATMIAMARLDHPGGLAENSEILRIANAVNHGSFKYE